VAEKSFVVGEKKKELHPKKKPGRGKCVGTKNSSERERKGSGELGKKRGKSENRMARAMTARESRGKKVKTKEGGGCKSSRLLWAAME